MSEQQEHWFAARTLKNQELSIRNSLVRLEVAHFFPTQFVIRELKHRRKRVEVPVINNLIFVRSTKELACDLPNKYGLHLFYMRDLETHRMLVVPDKQMQNFISMMALSPDCVSFDDDFSFVIGTRVEVIKGDFCGIEGELASQGNRSYVMIRLRGILSASVKVPKSYLRIIPEIQQ